MTVDVKICTASMLYKNKNDYYMLYNTLFLIITYYNIMYNYINTYIIMKMYLYMKNKKK